MVKMVSQKKIDQTKVLTEKVKKYSVIGLLDFYKLPSRQLQSMRKDLRGEVEILMRKKCVIKRALEGVKDKKGLTDLLELDAKKPALILTNMNPFKLYKILDENRSPTYAKPGEIAPKDIVVPEGPTMVPAGPAIASFQKAKIPAMVKEGRIHVRKQTKVVKKGEEINSDVASILKKVDIQPMEISIDLLAAWEGGTIFGEDVLAIDVNEYFDKLQIAYNHAINLSMNTGYVTKESVKLMIQKAFNEARYVGVECNILDKGVIEEVLKKAQIHAKNLKQVSGFND
jgi:large subunit ribosomal protein L10